MRFSHRAIIATYGRNLVFGVEDGIVSTVGLLSGIAVAGVPRATIILTGTVLIAVEALSMAVGSFLSEASAEEYLARRDGPSLVAVVSGIIMFASYLVAGFVPLAPYLVLDGMRALPVSIAASLVVLLLIGFLSGRVARVHPLRSALRMLVLGGLAITIGIFVGNRVR